MGASPDRRAFCLAAAAAVVVAFVQPAVAQQDADLARAVKASYLYKFAPFVTWPEGAFASPDAPFAICVLGDPVMADLVERAVAGLQVEGRPFAVRQPADVGRGSDCRILYLGSPRRTAAAEVLETVRGRPILTITDSAHRHAARGVVHFLVQAGRVRFEIDARLANENGLTISSHVLELALRVKRAGRPGTEAVRS